MKGNTTLKTSAVGRLGAWGMVFFLGLILSACGNKGDLYLPAPEAAQIEQTAEQMLEQQGK